MGKYYSVERIKICLRKIAKLNVRQEQKIHDSSCTCVACLIFTLKVLQRCVALLVAEENKTKSVCPIGYFEVEEVRFVL